MINLKALLSRILEFISDLDGISDYVVEQGTDGIWTYRKWNSGKAECWGTATRTGTWTAWGSLYELINSNGQSHYKETLPTGLFINAPSCFGCPGKNAMGVLLETFGNPSTESTDGFIPVRPSTSTTTTIYVSIYVIGNWK